MIWSWWALAVIPVAWLVQNCLHEGSHLLLGWLAEGRKPLGFWPYPHKANGKWYFARCRSGQSTTKRSPRWRYISPVLAGVLWAALFIGLIFAVPIGARVFLLPFAICGAVDALWWWRGYFWGRPTSDGQRFRHA